MSVELALFLQCSFSTNISAPPKQTALFIQFVHLVEFHVNEYVPAEHTEHV